MRVLPDANVLLWVMHDAPRVAHLRPRLEDPGVEVFVSVAALWEIAIKHGLGKLGAGVQVTRAACARSGYQELSIVGAHIERLASLAPLHRDPFDRVIVAQALAGPMTLITGDNLLRQYDANVELA